MGEGRRGATSGGVLMFAIIQKNQVIVVGNPSGEEGLEKDKGFTGFLGADPFYIRS